MPNDDPFGDSVDLGEVYGSLYIRSLTRSQVEAFGVSAVPRASTTIGRGRGRGEHAQRGRGRGGNPKGMWFTKTKPPAEAASGDVEMEVRRPGRGSVELEKLIVKSNAGRYKLCEWP